MAKMHLLRIAKQAAYIHRKEFVNGNSPGTNNQGIGWVELLAKDRETVVAGSSSTLDLNGDALFVVLNNKIHLIIQQNELKNRYMLVNPPEEWEDLTGTGQVQDKLGTSARQAKDILLSDDPNIEKLVSVIGPLQMSVKQMMEATGLKGRDNFLNLYLNPSISGGFIRLLYPESPRHPRQKYLLTVKGLALYNELLQEM